MHLDLFNNERRIAIPKFHRICLFSLTPTYAVLGNLRFQQRINFD